MVVDGVGRTLDMDRLIWEAVRLSFMSSGLSGARSWAGVSGVSDIVAVVAVGGRSAGSCRTKRQKSLLSTVHSLAFVSSAAGSQRRAYCVEPAARETNAGE